MKTSKPRVAAGLADVQAALRSFVNVRDWGKFHTPKNLVMALAGEVGELTELFQWLTPEESVAVMRSPVAATKVEDELADVVTYCLRLADVLEIDLIRALQAKLEKNAAKYPVELSRGHARKYTELGSPGPRAKARNGKPQRRTKRR